MTVPDFETIMLLILTLAKDGQEHTIYEAEDTLQMYSNLQKGNGTRGFLLEARCSAIG